MLLRTLEAIAQRGLVPVVAHPERYDAVQRDPGLAAWCFSRGMLLQLNKGSLLGLLGSRAEDTALHLPRTVWRISSRATPTTTASAQRASGRFCRCSSPYATPIISRCSCTAIPRRILRDEPIPIPPLQSD